MPRPALHKTDALLDAARALIIEAGPRGAGIRDIAQRSGAPSGSLYHRFGSRDNLLALAWLRAVRGFQAGFLEALQADGPYDAIRHAVRWSVEYALSEPADTQLLLCFAQADLLDSGPLPDVAEELAAANLALEEALRQLARRLFGTPTARNMERVSYAVIDLPYAVLRRHILAGTLSRRTVATLQCAALAIVTDGKEPSG
jgi:AcrR family transcriptional regulator